MSERNILMKTRLVLFFVLLISVFFGCKTKKIVSEHPKIRPIDEFEFIENISETGSKSDFVFFRKSLVQFSSEKVSHTFRANIYVVKDSSITISVLAPMGIEVARVSLNIDSVVIIDRMNRNVVFTDYSEIDRKFGIDVNFEVFENILLNKPFSFFERKNISLLDYHFGIDNDQYKLSSINEKGRRKNRINQSEIWHKMWFQPDSYRLDRISFSELKDNMVLDVVYDNFESVGAGIIFPGKLRMFGNKGLKKISLEVTHGHIEFNSEQSISFHVPEKYDKIYR